MGSHLVYDDRELSTDLPSVPAIAEAIGMRIERCLVQGGASGFAWQLIGESPTTGCGTSASIAAAGDDCNAHS
jgi:hypothetical protein